MNKKLLYKTSRVYIIYSVLVVLIAVPVFYHAIQGLYIKEADDTLLLHKKEFIKYHLPSLQARDIDDWNRFNRNAKIDNFLPITTDTFFSTHYFDTLDTENEPYRELNTPVSIQNNPYTFKARLNLVETEELMLNIVALFLLILLLLLVGLFIITKKLSLRLWKPFYETLNQIESFELDKNNAPVLNKTNIEEFNRLNTSIYKLIEKNTLIYRSQREFVDHAAHELQTPLAVFQSKLDIMMQQQELPEDQFNILNSLNESVSRLTRVNKNLLLLSKIENDSYSDRQAVSLNELFNKNADFFIEQTNAKQIRTELILSHNNDINANATLVEILLSNLFMNAIRHNITGGSIFISTAHHSITFANTGKDQPLDGSKIFQRFYKADTSHQGTGLGLSIVKKITDMYNWKLEYKYNNHLHVFTVIF